MLSSPGDTGSTNPRLGFPHRTGMYKRGGEQEGFLICFETRPARVYDASTVFSLV